MEMLSTIMALREEHAKNLTTLSWLPLCTDAY